MPGHDEREIPFSRWTETEFFECLFGHILRGSAIGFATEERSPLSGLQPRIIDGLDEVGKLVVSVHGHGPVIMAAGQIAPPRNALLPSEDAKASPGL